MFSKHALLANSHFDLLCLTGPRMQQMIRRFAPEIELNTVATGFLPFCEFPVATPEHRHRTLRRLGLDPALKTILYTPSRRGTGSWDLLAEQLAKSTQGSFNLILRPHPSQSLTSRHADRTSFRRVTYLAAARPNTLVDLTSYALSSLLSIADLLISDANSPAEESLFYDVPQLFIETPLYSADTISKQAQAEKMHPDDTAQLLRLFECGRRQYLDAPMELSESIELAIEAAPSYAERRSDYFTWVFGEHDRSAHQRVAHAISNHLLS
jgi:CDP-glycerol glycerophosphotransferase (TagB/SpsB family)